MGREIEVKLPTFHASQRAAYEVYRKNRRVVIRCGRRWGKTDFDKIIAADAAIRGQLVGWFAPDYRRISEAYNEIVHVLQYVKQSSSKTEGVIRTITGGRIDFWTLLDESAGRSRKYHKVIIDEAAFTKTTMMGIWEKAIEPTLLDYSGKCVVTSNTNGVADDNFLFQICEPDHKREFGVPGKKYGFAEFHATAYDNPLLPIRKPGESDSAWSARREEEFDRIKARNHPLVFQQEYLADFVDFSGVSFFSKEKMLVNGEPVPYPEGCETVLAVIDTAVKEGKEHDATAVSYWAVMPNHFTDYRLVCLDWDLISMDGALLEQWMPSVFERLQELSRDTRAIYGSAGAFIEDAQSGSILIQQCALRNWPAEALPEELKMAGKDGRAINVSGAVFRGDVKFSDYAYHKTTVFKDISRNHMLTQVSTFRVGDKEASKRSDDLLDTFTYAIAITLGDNEGIA
jgi:phage terminase large subunit-like protein